MRRGGRDPFFQKKSLSQVFLKVEWPVVRMVERLKFLRAERVMEIGPGNGVLTRELLKQGFKVTAIEKDTRFAQKMHDYSLDLSKDSAGRLEVFNADILDFDWEGWIGASADKPVVIGNIPYNISSPIMLRGTALMPRMAGMMLMTQLEFAQRVAARPDTKDYGSLTVYSQLRCDTTLEFVVPRTCYQPVPKVDSAVVLCLPRREVLPASVLAKTEKVTRVSFTQRRKKLRNSIRPFLNDDAWAGDPKLSLEEREKRCPIDLERRADALSPREFVALAEYLLPD